LKNEIYIYFFDKILPSVYLTTLSPELPVLSILFILFGRSSATLWFYERWMVKPEANIKMSPLS